LQRDVLRLTWGFVLVNSGEASRTRIRDIVSTDPAPTTPVTPPPSSTPTICPTCVWTPCTKLEPLRWFSEEELKAIRARVVQRGGNPVP